MLRPLVIGIGNSDRGDDGTGCEVSRRLRETRLEGIEVVEHGGDPAKLVEAFAGRPAVWLIDAAVSAAAPGTVRRFDVGTDALPTGLGHASSHGIGVAEAIELARALEVLPGRCVVITIEGVSFEPGAALSPPVEAAAQALVMRLAGELRGATGTSPNTSERSGRKGTGSQHARD